MLQLDLQRFAGEKTERATPKRRQEARKEGRFPKSADLTSAIGLVGILMALKFVGPSLWSAWMNIMQQDFSANSRQPLTERDVTALFYTQLWQVLQSLIPLICVALGLGLLIAFVQIGPVFLPKLLLPDFNRVNIGSGVQRLFSPHSTVEAVKSLAKLLAVGAIVYMVIHGMASQVAMLGELDVQALPGAVGAMVFQIGIYIAVLMVALSVLDFIFQRFDFEKSIRMSREEIKQELKQQEGDPIVKGQIRQRGRRLAMRRMMQEVPKADVVITNPTHFAVALKYDASCMAAPEVIAKGQDDVAFHIRRLAEEHGIVRVENRPLAQALYHTVEVGRPVPSDLYQAVAEVLAYVYRLKQIGTRG